MKKAGLLVLLVAAAFAVNTATASAATTNIFWSDPEVTTPFDPDPEIFWPDPLVQSN